MNAGNVTSPEAAQCGFLIRGTANNFTLGGAADQGFTFSGGTSPRLIQLNNAPSNVKISYNKIDTTGDANTGINIGAAGATGLTVSNNIFIADEDATYQDWPVTASAGTGKLTDLTITNNEFTGSGTPNKYGAAIDLVDVQVTNLTESVIANNSISGFDRGIIIATDTVITSDLSITQNTISGCAIGIRFKGDPSLINLSTVTVDHNNISGNSQYGLKNEFATGTVTATCNWWGDSDGPQHASNPYTTTGDPVSDNVTFAPWLTSQAPGGVCAYPIPFLSDVEDADITLGDWVIQTPSAGLNNLWHRVAIDTKSNCPGYKSPPEEIVLGSYDWWFGQDYPNCTYDYTGERKYGELISPQITIPSLRVSAVTLSFDSFRDVECYDKGGYDKTYVEYTTDGGNTWTQVWYKDSADCPGATAAMSLNTRGPISSPRGLVSSQTISDETAEGWTHEGPISIPVTPGGKVQVRFVFDTVDGFANNFLGWEIDNIEIVSGAPAGLWFLEQSLPEGLVTQSYSATIHVVGGTGIYSWRQTSPWPEAGDWLSVNFSGDTCTLSGTPTQLGTYQLCIGVSDDRGDTCSRCYNIIIEQMISGGELFYDDFETVPDLNWTTTGLLWHRTQNTPCVSPPYASPTHVYYYGKDATCNYVTGETNSGTLLSPDINVSGLFGGTKLTIGWKYWRQVESYLDGIFDVTKVYYRFDSGSWTEIWSMDSTDPSTCGWKLVEITYDATGAPLVVVPAGASCLYIQFKFDTVDGCYNNYVGWLIDDVKVIHQEQPESELHITSTCVDLDKFPDDEVYEAQVGVPYSVQLEAAGGTGNNIWSWDCGAAWNAVGLDMNSSGLISGTPTQTASELCCTFTVTDDAENTDTLDCCIDIKAGEPCPCYLLEQDFENGWQDNLAPGVWTPSGLWHIATAVLPCEQCVCSPMTTTPGNHFARFARPAPACDYATGNAEVGYLTSPAITVDSSCIDDLTLQFMNFREVEDVDPGYDRTDIQISWNGGTTWTTIWHRDSANQPAECKHHRITPIPVGGTTLLVRFVFNTVDYLFNDYCGWFIDDVFLWRETCAPTAPGGTEVSAPLGGTGPLAAARDQITVLNIPNPVRDVDTTTFTVRGVGIEAIKIQIFDLDETLIFEEEVDGNELTWHTVNDYGEYLANGVYFYRALVKMGGKWVTTSFQKLVILR